MVTPQEVDVGAVIARVVSELNSISSLKEEPKTLER